MVNLNTKSGENNCYYNISGKCTNPKITKGLAGESGREWDSKQNCTFTQDGAQSLCSVFFFENMYKEMALQKAKELTKLYTIVQDVKCLKCGTIGAVKSYGTYNSKKDKVSHTLGFGGTVPYFCLNCGNIGLIGINGLEGYKRAFVKNAQASTQNVEVAP